MNEEAFKEFYLKNNLKEEIIKSNLVFIRKYEEYLRTERDKEKIENTSLEDLDNFINNLMSLNQNTLENFIALIRLFIFIKREDLKSILLELIDGVDVFKNLFDELEKELDSDTFSKLTAGINLPPLGTKNTEKPKITKKVIDRMEENLEKEQCEEILSRGLHRLRPETLNHLREQFLAAENIDDFLAKKHQQLVENLEKNFKEGTRFFTQEVDEEVIEYVKKNKTIEMGLREGDKIIITKIPYMTKDYIHEQDDEMKRYHYCHCPWAREALRTGEIKISPMFCNCTAGFYKQQWDAVLDQQIKVELLESVLKGDEVCKFTLQLPDQFIPKS